MPFLGRNTYISTKQISIQELFPGLSSTPWATWARPRYSSHLRRYFENTLSGLLAWNNKSGLFCRLILSGPEAGGEVPDGRLMGLHQGFIQLWSRHICPTSTAQPSSIYLPYIPDKAPQDLCNKRFIVNLVLFVGVHQLWACRRPISLWLGNIIGMNRMFMFLPSPFLMKRPTFRCLQLNLYICTLKAIGLQQFRNN